jgi:glucose/arabinose dehydrogenase
MDRHVTRGLLSILLIIVAAGPAAAQVFSNLVSGGFDRPLYATTAPGDPGTLYVVQQGGQIRTLNSTTGQIGSTFLDLTTVAGANLQAAGSEQGLLGLAFHPGFQNNSGFIYVNYTFGTGSGSTRVERYQVNNGTVNTGSRQTVLEFAQPFSNHNGGWMGFHPTNGFLHIATGDGGSANDPQNNGQSVTTFLGKMLRIDVNGDAFPTDPNRNYAVPANNNTLGAAALPEIWAYGLRNPWRASFDRANGNMYIGDVGQNNREEIDFRANGTTATPNYGWRLREGRIATPTGNPPVGGAPPADNVEPIHDFDRSFGGSVTGGYVYRGGAILDGGVPLDGTYFFGDFISTRMWSFRFDGTTMTDFQERTNQLRNAVGGGTIGGISSFAEDGFGNLYIIDYGVPGNPTSGEIFRIGGTPVPEPAGILTMSGAAAAAWWLRRRRPVSERMSNRPH